MVFIFFFFSFSLSMCHNPCTAVLYAYILNSYFWPYVKSLQKLPSMSNAFLHARSSNGTGRCKQTGTRRAGDTGKYKRDGSCLQTYCCV